MSVPRTDVENAIHAYVVAASGLPAGRVRWRDGSAPRPAAPYIDIGLMSVRSNGSDWRVIADAASPAPGADITITDTGPREMVLTLTCFDGDETGAASAAGILEDVKSKQRLPVIHAALKVAGVAVTYRGPVTYVPGIRGTARFEPRATLELRCAVQNQVSENTTYIATVEVTNETTGAEFTVERTP